jgi:two-component sensor histidine kinase
MVSVRWRLIGLGLGTLLSIPACILLMAAEQEPMPGLDSLLRQNANQSLYTVEARLGSEMTQAILAVAMPPEVRGPEAGAAKQKPYKALPLPPEMLPPELLARRGWLSVARSGAEGPLWQQGQQSVRRDQAGIARARRLGHLTMSDLQLPEAPGAEPFVFLHSPMPAAAGGGVLSLALPLSALEAALHPPGQPVPCQTVLLDGHGQVLAPRSARLGDPVRAALPEGATASQPSPSGWQVLSGPRRPMAEGVGRQFGRLLPGAVLVGGLLFFMLLVWQTRRRAQPHPHAPSRAELEAERRLSDIAANLPGALFRLVRSADGTLFCPYLSEGIDALLGEPSGCNAQEALLRGLAPEARERAAQALAHSAESLTPFMLEGDFTTSDGRRLRLRSMASVHARADGAIIWDGVLLDSTEQRQAEERATLLAREVDHRAKNIMSVVRSLLLLTPRDVSPAQFVANLDGRISAMAHAHDLLAGQGWAGADLASVAKRELATYQMGEAAPQLRWSGPGVRLAPGSVQPVAMVLHELATNAAKHGALSCAGGQVELRWSGSPQGGLLLDWSESGGPRVVGEPGRLGFGFRLIHTLSRHQLGGGATFLWSASGLRCRIRLGPATIASIESEPELRPSDTPLDIPKPPLRHVTVEAVRASGGGGARSAMGSSLQRQAAEVAPWRRA